jgi:hypothetical protein
MNSRLRNANRRRRILAGSRSLWAALVLTAAVGSVVSFAAQTRGQASPESTRESGQSVTGAFEGWYQNPDGTYSLLMGYFNRNANETLEIPVGPNNRIEPGGPDQGQPTTFAPRRQWGIFRVVVPRDFGTRKLTWTIVANGQTTAIPMSLNPLWVVEPFKDAGNGNTPPVLKFDPAGPSFTGPPHGFARTFTAKLGEPLPLTLWVSDDKPLRGGRGAAAGPLAWSKFRGPGSVTFDNAKPAPDGEGKASATVKFGAPGDYILRAQANDATGDGGGGFQCCWTNVQVKVTVNP